MLLSCALLRQDVSRYLPPVHLLIKADTCKSKEPVHLQYFRDTHIQPHALQVCAERCEVLPMAKEHRGKSEPLFILYRVSLKTRVFFPARCLLQSCTWTSIMDQHKLEGFASERSAGASGDRGRHASAYPAGC